MSDVTFFHAHPPIPPRGVCNICTHPETGFCARVKESAPTTPEIPAEDAGIVVPLVLHVPPSIPGEPPPAARLKHLLKFAGRRLNIRAEGGEGANNRGK